MITVTHLSPAEALLRAADLIERRGLCLDHYEGKRGSLCPAGAIALVLDAEDAGIWSSVPAWFIDSGRYDAGFAAMYALVDSLDRWSMDHGDEPWDGESLANHLAFWLDDVRPSAELVVQHMRDAAASLSTPAEREVAHV
ncbi:MAG: hypothetical protein ABR585_07325 [Gemmatimonadaceae bacterium]